MPLRVEDGECPRRGEAALFRQEVVCLNTGQETEQEHLSSGTGGFRWLSGKGIRLLIRRLPVRFLVMRNDVVSLGKALHPTCLGGYVAVKECLLND